jgi:two-component system copper resistance phosphate regulon response regulator CusR
LLARIHALLRRSQQESETKLSIADLELECMSRTVKRKGQPISLTIRELELLEYLLRNKDAVVSREMLARDVWKATTRATPLDNVIDVHITHLRRKIDGPFDVKLLHTLRGVGFILSMRRP